jgi:hypothetical protein
MPTMASVPVVDRPVTPSRLRSECLHFLELLAAVGFAITQPVLSVFGRSPDEFIYTNSSALDIVLFAVTVCVVPALGLWVLEWLVGLVSRRARDVVHVFFLTGLALLFALQLVKRTTSLRGAALAALALLLAATFGVVYVRVRAAHLWLQFASPAPIVFVLLFLLASPVSPLVFEKDAAAAKLGSAGHAPSLVMITFDEWPTMSIVGRDGQIDRAHYPNLARLGESSSWYRNETSVTSATWHAVPAILTGQYPKDGDLPEATSHPQNLFTFLGGAYRLAVSEIVTRLCPRSLCAPVTPTGGGSSGLRALLHAAGSVYRGMVSPARPEVEVTTGFQERETQAAVDEAKQATGREDKASQDLGVATTNRPQRFTQFLDSLHRNEKPTVHFLHILLPHVVYRYLPSGQQYGFPSSDFGREGDDWTDDAWPPTLARERMQLQAAYVDRLVGELLDRLHSTGLFDRSVVVITADHGIAFTPGEPARALSTTPVPESIYPQLLWAPLFVKASEQTRGVVSDANVMSIDILPTIAKLVGFKLPWKVDGVPAGERKDDIKYFQKSTANGFGVSVTPPMAFDGAPGEAAMLADNVDAATQPGDPALQLYRFGTEGALVGQPLSALSVGDAAKAEPAELVQLDALHHVDARSGELPALVWGSVDRSMTVAIVVNGTVAGVSPTFADGSTPNRFAAMVPEPLIKNGSNTVELFEVEGGGVAPLLHPLEVSGG